MSFSERTRAAPMPIMSIRARPGASAPRPTTTTFTSKPLVRRSSSTGSTSRSTVGVTTTTSDPHGNVCFSRWIVCGETLFLLDADGVLRALEGRYGALQWSREGVRELTTDGSALALGTATGMDLLEVSTGAVKAMLETTLPIGATYAWDKGRLLRLEGNTLWVLDVAGVLTGSQGASSSWATAYTDERDALVDIAGDSLGVVLLSAGGRLIALDENYSKTVERELGFAATSLAASEDRIVAAGASKSAGFGRTDLAPLFASNWGGAVLAAGLQKYFLADSNGLAALNGYDGALIWSIGAGQKDLAIAGEKLFSLNEMGWVVCYNAPDNLAPPATTLTPSPALPDGEHGYYMSLPSFSLSAKDAESYVQASMYQIGDGETKTYTAPVTLLRVCVEVTHHVLRLRIQPEQLETC